MREIKFRAWDGKTLLYSDENFESLSTFFGYYEGQFFFDKNNQGQPIGIIFMQSLGCKDKNGTEIYDCDRVRIRRHLIDGKDYIDYNCDIKWNGWSYCLFIHDKQMWGLDPITARECEIIGNIYENPTLIKQPN